MKKLEAKEIKKPMKLYRRFVKGKRYIVEADDLIQAEKLFKLLIK